MVALQWDKTGERFYETGVDHGVLFQVDIDGEYVDGVPWNGLTAVTESPSGAESNKIYADNLIYLNLQSVEEFGGTIEAFTYPNEFAQNDGSATPTPGVSVTQQTRKPFGFCWRTKVGNDLQGADFAYKIHMVWGALAAPSEKANATINDSPEPLALSWEVSTTPISIGTIDGIEYKPTAKMSVQSNLVDPAKLTALQDMLYGTAGTDPTMPLPADVIALMATTLTLVTPTVPAFNQGTNTITIPAVTGVKYTVNGVTKAPGALVITTNTIVEAHPLTGYKFPVPTDRDWMYTFV